MCFRAGLGSQNETLLQLCAIYTNVFFVTGSTGANRWYCCSLSAENFGGELRGSIQGDSFAVLSEVLSRNVQTD